MSFTQRLIETRKALGLSQEQFSKKVGCSRAAVNFWENAKNDNILPKPDNLEKCAEVLGVTADWLRFGDTASRRYKVIDSFSSHHIIARAPVLKTTEIRAWIDSKKEILKKGEEMNTQEVDSVCFIHVIENNAMESATDPASSIPCGAELLIDPSSRIEPGNIVLCQYGVTDNFKVRKYMRDGTDCYLQALNNVLEHMPVNDNVRIIGRVKRWYKDC